MADMKRIPGGVGVGNLVLMPAFTGEGGAIEDQVRAALGKAKATMEAAGGSMDNIVKTFFFATDLADYPMVRKTETEFYEAHAPKLLEYPPAATFIVVDALDAGARIAYEAVGVIDRAAPDAAVTYYPEFWGGVELAYPHVPKEHAKFARTQVVGNLVIVSGCQALDHGTVKVETDDFREQTLIVLEKLKIGMDETGGALGNLVKTNVLIDDLANLALYRETERDYFRTHAPALAETPPASTVYVAKRLPRPEFKIEVEAYGVIDRAAPAGSLLFASGHGATSADAALDALAADLRASGGAIDRIFKIVVQIRRAEDASTVRAAIEAYWRAHAPGLVAEPPLETLLVMPALADESAAVQIDAVAVA